MKKLLLAVFAVFAFAHRSVAYALARVEFAAMILLFPGLAFAQSPTAPPPAAPSAESSFFVLLLPHVLPLIGSLLLTVAFPALYGWINAKKSSEVAAGHTVRLLSIGEKVAHLAELTVATVDAKMVPDLAARAAKGQLTAADGVALRADGLNMLKDLLTPAGLAQVAAALGTPKAPAAPSVVDSYLVGHNEVAVDAKNAGAGPAPA